MNADTLEAITERAAIMEFDGGLSRRDATLAAFGLYPAALRECEAMRGEADLADFLESVIDRGIATGREGLAALEYMAGQGIPLIGVYDSKAMIGNQEPENFTADTDEIAAIMAGAGNQRGLAKGKRVRRFYFIPADAGLLCLDIDRKPGKPDGLQQLYNLFPKDTLPRALQDIERFFPCYVSTPSGGYHLYFKYSGATIPKINLCPEVEIKHGKPGLTAPGSVNADGKPYPLHGDIEAAPPLYGIIIDRIRELQAGTKAATHIPQAQNKKNWGKPSWEKIRTWTETDGAGAGRNDRAFHLARHARNHEWTETETLDALRAEPSLAGLPESEIKTAVKSAYSYRGKTA